MTTEDCISRSALVDFLADRAPREGTRVAPEHIDACPRCRALLDELSDDEYLREQVRRYGDPDSERIREPAVTELIERVISAGSSVLRGSTVRNVVAKEAARPARLIPPCDFGDYRILDLLRRGTVAEAYRAIDMRRQSFAVVKVVAAGRAIDAARWDGFRIATERAAQLRHPHVASPREAGDIAGTRFVERPFVDGCDLARVARRLGQLRVADVCEVVRQAAAGLAAAHASGVVHGNVKPSNLLLDESGHVQVADFGWNRLQFPIASDLIGAVRPFEGTVDYLAPEQTTGKDSDDPRIDLYALGCVLFQLLGGEPPFHGRQYDAPLAKLFGHRHDQPPRLESLRGGLLSEVVSLADRLLAKDPRRRPQSAREVAASLEPHAAGADLATLLPPLAPLP